MSFSGSRNSRRWSSARRRQARATRIFLLVASLLAIASFFGGYAWKSANLKAAAARTEIEKTEIADPAARAAALDAIDEAVAAKFEGRGEDALAAIKTARAADPNTPGIDILRAQFALESGNFSLMRSAALTAKKHKENFAGASLMLALGNWIGGGPGEAGHLQAIDAANAHFTEGAEANFFDSSLWFFWGDLLRSAGRKKEGYSRAQEALHRLNLWDSCLMLSLKSVLAATESPTGPIHTQILRANSEAQDAIVSLQQAATDGADPSIARAELQRFLTFRQAQLMASDSALAAKSGSLPVSGPLP